MTSVSSFVFVLHILLTLRSAVYQKAPFGWQKLSLGIMLAAPYIVYFAILIPVMISGNQHPHRIYRSEFYCAINVTLISDLAPGASAVAVVASIVVEVFIAITLRRSWRAFRDLGSGAGPSLTLVIRALVFTIFAVLALATCVVLLANYTSSVPDIVIACLPMAAFLLFGTQADLLRVWGVRRKNAMALENFGSKVSTSPPPSNSVGEQ